MRSIKRPFTLGRHAPDRTPEPAATSIHDMRRYHTIIFHAAASILAPQPVRQIWLELVGTPRERASATAERRTQLSEESSHRKRRMALNAHGRCAKKKKGERRAPCFQCRALRVAGTRCTCLSRRSIETRSPGRGEAASQTCSHAAPTRRPWKSEHVLAPRARLACVVNARRPS